MLLDDFEDATTAELRARRLEDRAEGVGGTTLLADDLTEIDLRDSQLNDGGAFTFAKRDFDLLGFVDEGLDHGFDEAREAFMGCLILFRHVVIFRRARGPGNGRIKFSWHFGLQQDASPTIGLC